MSKATNSSERNSISYKNEDLGEALHFDLFMNKGQVYSNVSVEHSGVKSYAVIAVPMEFLMAVQAKGREFLAGELVRLQNENRRLKKEIKDRKADAWGTHND